MLIQLQRQEIVFILDDRNGIGGDQSLALTINHRADHFLSHGLLLFQRTLVFCQIHDAAVELHGQDADDRFIQLILREGNALIAVFFCICLNESVDQRDQLALHVCP